MSEVRNRRDRSASVRASLAAVCGVARWASVRTRRGWSERFLAAAPPEVRERPHLNRRTGPRMWRRRGRDREVSIDFIMNICMMM